MSDLPHEPDFPVFGLGPAFFGYRWLALWNEPDQLYLVTLGHGRPGADEGIFVTTILKTPERHIGDGPLVSKGPTGFQDAMMHAIIGLAERGHPADRAAMMAFIRQESARVGPGTAKSDLSPGWERSSTVVAGHPCTSWHRELNGAWAALLDLPAVSVSVSGTRDTPVPSALEDVRASLSDYV